MSQKLSGRAAAAFKNIAFPKFAATVNPEGTPNVVPLLSARMIDPETIAFVRFMVWKTARNFERNKKITFACMGPKARTYLAKGEFQEWVTQGPLIEQFESEPLYRYNAYTGANAVGVVKVIEVMEWPGPGVVVNTIQSLARRLGPGQGSASSASGNGPMPVQVKEKWNRAAAVKFLGLVDGRGDPLALPHQGVHAPDSRTLAFALPRDKDHPLSLLSPGQMMAAAVLAFEPTAYQVKGRFAPSSRDPGRVGTIEVTEVYTAAPPVPGRRIYPPELPAS